MRLFHCQSLNQSRAALRTISGTFHMNPVVKRFVKSGTCRSIQRQLGIKELQDWNVPTPNAKDEGTSGVS